MIFDSLEGANTILLLQDPSVNFMPIINQVIRKHLTNEDVTFLCCQRRVEVYEELFKNSKIKFVDCFIKPPDLKEINPKSAVVIDSLDHLCLLQSWDEILTLFQTLTNCLIIKKLISVINTDCLIYGEQMLKHFKYLHQLHLTIEKVENKSFLQMYYKKSGKVVKTTEEIHYDNKTGIITTSQLIKNNTKEEKQSVLPHSVASFRIGLKEDEMQARDSVQLPYMSRGAGHITYTPDAADDWDDDDPDDDLEI